MSIIFEKNYELKSHSTFKIGGEASIVFFPKNEQELIEAILTNDESIVLGACSNVLISSLGVEKPVIITMKADRVNIENDIIEADCGVKGPYLSKLALERSLSGFEFMIGFPGSIGGMVYMNASSHNQAISDTFVSCKVYDVDNKKVLDLNKSDMHFGYRTSILQKNNWILLSAKFRLKKFDKSSIENIVNRNLEFRKKHQPDWKKPNIGSIFKNPNEDSAGRLLDLSGVKELKCGGAGVFGGHANFIINENNATSSDVLNLMLKMRNMVEEKYSIKLVPEVKFIGVKTNEDREIWDTLQKN